MATVFAAADIGSNTAHLLVAGFGEKGLQRLANASEWLSLGQVVSHEGHVPPASADKLVKTLAEFRLQARAHGASSLYVFATEAMRRASNHRSLISRIRKETGIPVEIVTPRREAELSLKGSLMDTEMHGSLVLIEAGGGSVQIAYCQDSEMQSEHSFPLGTGVLIDKTRLRQPATPTQILALGDLVDSATQRVSRPSGPFQVLASGGVARGLWRALHPDGERTIHREELSYLAWSTRRLNTATISARYSVKTKRANTLLPGSIVYLTLLDRLGATTMTVSEFGVREGAVLELSQGRLPNWKP